MTKTSHIVWAIVFLFTIIVILPSIYVSVRSSDPEFCLSCHYEKPFYESWKESTHSDIACIACHPNLRYRMPWLTFRYMTGLYDMQTHADVETDTCLACHDRETLFTEPVQLADEKSFSHKQHLSEPLRGVELRCASCHSHIVQGNHKSVEETVCFNCHFMGASPADSITGCESCHGTPKETVMHHGFSFNHSKYLKLGMECGECHLKVTEGTGQMQPGACHTCHVEPAENVSREQVHEIHVSGSGIDCFECHGDIEHGNLEMVRTFNVACTDCHENLHGAQKALYMGVGGEGIGDYPSRMFAAQVTCDGCHTDHQATVNAFATESTGKPDPQTCVECHEPGYDSMLDDWDRAFPKLLNYVDNRIRNATPRAKSTDARAAMELVKKNLDLVKYGQPAHNVEYGVKLLQFNVNELDKIDRKPVSHRPAELRAPDAYCASMCHNRLGMPEDLLFEEIAFPHETHMIAVSEDCGYCHSVEHHGETTLSLQQCNTCHHVELDDVEDRCIDCHGTEAAFYEGRLALHEEGDPNYMLDSVGCLDCHDVTAGEPITLATVRQTCIDCHDEDYGDMMDDWVATGLGHRKDLADRLKELETLATNGKTITKADAKIVEAEFKKFKAVHAIFKRHGFLHNPDYADQLNDVAMESYNTILEILK